MKKLSNLKGAKILEKKEQQSVLGGSLNAAGPCGKTGGFILACNVSANWCWWQGGAMDSNGCCWACY